MVSLHLYFKNPDGSVTLAGWWALATVTLVWTIAGIRIFMSPDETAANIGRLLRITPSRALARGAAITVFGVGAAVGWFVLSAVPGRLY